MSQPTQLVYMENFTLFQNVATVVEVRSEGGRDVVMLDQTIFYPQGGGQPYDQGTMTNEHGNFVVEEVRFVDGLVKHIGHFASGTFQERDSVTCVVDEGRRTLHSRLHSAGHVVDMAIAALNLPWTPGKGFHFPDGPYVEYAGSLEGLDKEALKSEIEQRCNQLIQENHETKLLFLEKEKMSDVCHFVPDEIPEGKPARVVQFGNFGVPCGGTHVSKLMEIGSMTIRKIKLEKGNIRVGYAIASS